MEGGLFRFLWNTMAWRPGLNHIEFWVSSLERSVPFYDDLRGPLEQSYSEGYYTVNFRDSDGYVLEDA